LIKIVNCHTNLLQLLCFPNSEVEALNLTPPLNDVIPVSGVLQYAAGERTKTFTVGSIQDIEEEGDEVFSVILVATTGGATLSPSASRTTLTGLFFILFPF
jgi:hypothetical protein